MPTAMSMSTAMWLLAVGTVGTASAHESIHGHKRAAMRPPPLILSALPSLSEAPIAAAFDWRDVDGRNFVTTDVNQHIPTYCGSCWIHGTIAALNDRIKIARGAQFPDVMLSRQVAMNCVHSLDDPHQEEPPSGCQGGDPWAIHSHMVHSPLPDETCQPYEAKNGACLPAGQCRNCFHPLTMADPSTPAVEYTSPGCFAVDAGVRFGVSEYGGLSGPAAMQREIQARGPIVCSFAADSTFMLRFEERLVEGVYVDPTYFTAPMNHTKAEVDHDIEITGWGTTPNGLPYWVARNSWGTYWGERGWFKVLRGANHLFIEDDCAWAVPDLSAFDANVAAVKVGDYVTGRQRTVADEPSAGQVTTRAAAAVAAASRAAAAAAEADAHVIKGKAKEARAVEAAQARVQAAELAAELAVEPAQPALLSLSAIEPRAAAPQAAADQAAVAPAAQRAAASVGSGAAKAAGSGGLSLARVAACAVLGLAGVAAWRATASVRRAQAGARAREAVAADWDVAEATYTPM